jgi:hypothetical protein
MKSSRPIRILASHSANVQFRKVVSTMVHPNCSILGHLEIAEKINVAPMSVDKTHPMMRCHFRRFIE